MDNIYDWIQNITGFNIEVQDKIFVSMLMIAVLWLIRSITYKIVCNKTENAQTRYRWHKSLTYITVIIGIIVVGRVWFAGMQSIATYLGLVSAGIAIALKDFNMFGMKYRFW